MALPHIKIGDDLIEDALLASVDITQEVNQHWWCKIICRQTEDKRVPVEEFLGQSVKVQTTDQEGIEHVHFAGFVLDVELTYEVWGSYTAQILCMSNSYKLDLTARKAYYVAQTLEQVANTAAGHVGLSASVNGSSQKALNYVQYGETDFSFINRIVDDYGCWLRPTEAGIDIYSSFQGGATVQFRGEDGLLDFKIKGTLAPATFNGSHYDHHAMSSNTFEQIGGAPRFYSSSARLVSAVQSQSQSLLPSGFAPQRARVMTLSDYQDVLQKESQRSIGGSITGYGHSRSPQLQAGDTVAIEGNLDAKGTYGLIQVVHRWEPSGYINSFICTPWKDYRNPQQPVTRTWNGVVSARVVEHNDPKKMGRLKVQFFWQSDNSTHWARMVSPHAGPDRGFMFMPEVGDEVAVAFEDGDPERPVILGSLWNGVQQAPRYDFRGGDIVGNDVKRVVTKAGNRIHLSDKPGQETVFFATPNHTSFSMTEKSDETGRNLITLHSDGDIILNAPNGRVHVNSKFFSRETGKSS